MRRDASSLKLRPDRPESTRVARMKRCGRSALKHGDEERWGDGDEQVGGWGGGPKQRSKEGGRVASRTERNGIIIVACLVVDNNPIPQSHLNVCLIQVAHRRVSFCIALCGDESRSAPRTTLGKRGAASHRPEGNEESRRRGRLDWIGLDWFLRAKGQTGVKKPRVLRSHLAGQRRLYSYYFTFLIATQHHNTTTQHIATRTTRIIPVFAPRQHDGGRPTPTRGDPQAGIAQ